MVMKKKKKGVSVVEVNYNVEGKKDRDACWHEVVIVRFRWWWGGHCPPSLASL